MSSLALKLDQEEHEVLFCALALVEYGAQSFPWVEIDYDQIKHMVEGEIQALDEEQSLESFFDFYRKEHAVYNLADYISYKKQQSFNHFAAEMVAAVPVHGKAERRGPMSTEIQDIRRDLQIITGEVTSYMTLFDEKLWNYLGGASRIPLHLFFKLAGEAVHSSSDQRVMRLCKVSPVDCTHYQALRVDRDIKGLREKFGLVFDGEYEANRIEGLEWDIQVLGELLSFPTLASEECLMYLQGGRRLPIGRVDRQITFTRYLKAVIRVLPKLTGHAKAVICNRSRSKLKDYIRRKQELTLVSKRFGSVYNRARTVNATLDIGVGDFTWFNHLAIFHGIRQHMATRKETCSETITIVIKDLMEEDIIKPWFDVDILRNSFCRLVLLELSDERVEYLTAEKIHFYAVKQYLVDIMKLSPV